MERNENGSTLNAKRLGEKLRRDRISNFGRDVDRFIELANEHGAGLDEDRRKLGRIERGEQMPTVNELVALCLVIYKFGWENALVDLLRYAADSGLFVKMVLYTAIECNYDKETIRELLNDAFSCESIPAGIGGLE